MLSLEQTVPTCLIQHHPTCWTMLDDVGRCWTMLDDVGRCWMKFDLNQTFYSTSPNISIVF